MMMATGRPLRQQKDVEEQNIDHDRCQDRQAQRNVTAHQQQQTANDLQQADYLHITAMVHDDGPGAGIAGCRLRVHESAAGYSRRKTKTRHPATGGRSEWRISRHVSFAAQLAAQRLIRQHGSVQRL